MTCSKCRSALPPKAARCPRCGTRPAGPTSVKPRKTATLYGAIAGGVFLVFVIVLAVKILAANQAGRRLADQAEQLVKADEAWRAVPPKAKSTTYKDDRLGFEIAIPAGWEARPREGSSTVLEMTDGGSPENAFVLVVQPLRSDQFVYASAWQSRLGDIVRDLTAKLGGEVVVTRKEEGTCHGHPSFLVTYACRGKDAAMRMLQYMVVTRARSYVLTWTASEERHRELFPVFEKTSKAFSIAPPDTIAPAAPTTKPAPGPPSIAPEEPA